MSELRFDGKVVIVTGGGGALGRSHCLLFASRGASVVVNDLGVSLSGSTDASNTSSAEKVVNEIKALGGKAVANHDDVCEGQRIIDCAINTFGRVDILINNAGNLQDKSFANMTSEMWDSVLRVHLKGAFALTKAAWPHMVKQKYGRIIMTISAAGLYGNYGQANYSTAKLALVGFMNSLSKEGANSNIYINAVAPVAGSRMTETMMPKDLVQALKPEFISPIVAYLSHDSSTTNGDIFECGAGYFAPVRFQRGPGATFSIQAPPTVEQLKSRWNDISQFPTNGEGCEYPKSAKDSIATIIANLTNTTASSVATDGNTNTKNSNSTPTPAPTKSNGNGNPNAATGPGVATKFNNGKDLPGEFKSETLIDILSEFLDADVVKKTKAIFVFDVTNGDKKNRKWTIDLKNGEGKISSGIVEGVKPDAIMSCSDADFVRLIYQEIHPQKLFMTGKLKVKGNLALAMKFEQVIRSLEHKAKGKL